ncbi:nucleolin-like [Centruroides vittatus]|uniref:nucleolin-like n=1 Tax=Centruroides vittatus TaxID=120091 RepID=UPI00350F2ECF
MTTTTMKDDDDDDDEEEEEDDDEEEEEDDDEDEKEAPKLVKAVEPPAKKAKNDVPSIDLKASEEQRRKDRDIRSLFIRGFPDDTTEEEIKALSSDIISVRLPANKKRKRPGMQGGYAFVEFKSEKIAEDNFSVLEKKKIKGKELFVDFVGTKSKNKAFVDRTKERDQRNINKQKLFVSNIPNEATMEDLGKAFPAAVNVYLNSGANKTAQISFDSEEAAAEAFKKNSSLKIKGTPVVVLYALINKHRNKGKGGRGQGSPRRPFHRGQGFRKSFNEQRKPTKHSFGDEDDDE